MLAWGASRKRSGKWRCNAKLRRGSRRVRRRPGDSSGDTVNGERRSAGNLTSRRRFLQALGGMGMGSALGGESLFPGPAYPRPEVSPTAFEKIPSSGSGFSWGPWNWRSPMAHLPETVGAGCAFLDYDNDGWMDIYLVNSGLCDFYEQLQPLRNALYHNNR